MLVAYSWLKELVDIDEEPKVISEKLMLSGIENTIITPERITLKDVLTARIVKMDPHPDADHLQKCQLETDEASYIVLTSAKNIKLGDIVPLAIAGGMTADGKKIEKTTFRGIESEGMVCSPDEVGIGEIDLPHEEKEGILILPEDTPLGRDIQEIIDLEDAVFELELTPNRSDCLSMVGVAYEIAALYNKTLSIPESAVEERGRHEVEEIAGLKILEPELCPRCTVRVIEDVKIEPSPYWLQEKLRACGIRPINNIVDMTNFVMMEFGQPMHAYDYDKLAGHQLIIRKAKEGEKIKTIDESEHQLSSDHLIIADEEKPVGLAGVMGGYDTEITQDTQKVLLEAASFEGINIRKTYRKLNLRSEAASRFEKNVDPNTTPVAMNRACRLIEQIGAGKASKGMLDSHPIKTEPAEITVRISRINHLLGTDLSLEQVEQIIKGLHFPIDKKEMDAVTVTVPTRKKIIKTESDMIEEIARLYGLNNVTGTLPYGNSSQGTKPRPILIEEKAKEILVSAGMREAMTFSFMNESSFDHIHLDAEDELRKAIKLTNPLSEEQGIMRTTLIPNILEVLRYNYVRQMSDMKVFELANVYLTDKLPLHELPVERRTLTCAVIGKSTSANWLAQREPLDFFSLKGVIDSLAEKLGLGRLHYRKANYPTFHPGRTAEIYLGHQRIGVLGEIHPDVADNYDLNERCCLCEMDFESMVENANIVPNYRPLPRFPSVTRDLAIIVEKDIEQGQIMDVITSIGGEMLEKAVLFDVYEGDQIEAGYKSLGYSLTFRGEEKTLTDEEVDHICSGIMAVLDQNFNAKLRS